MDIYKVEEGEAGKRLDLFLTFKLPQYSRSAIRKLLDQGKVNRGEEVEYRPNYKVKQDDVFFIKSDESLSRKHLSPYEKEIPILYEDEHVVAVNKPAGLKVHPVKESDTKSLLNAMYFNLEDRLTDYGVNLVNRIDKPTSGIVLLAKSAKGAWHYAKEFAEGRAKKDYLSVVKGNWLSKYGDQEIQQHNFLQYDHVLRKQKVDKEQGDFSHTSFLLLEYNPKTRYCLVLAKPLTGRTHQIRVQLAHIGFPIVGDKKYEGESFKGLCLHAYRLRISKVDGGELDIKAPIPDVFRELGFSYGS